jgi:hypothetical protein
MCVADPSGVRVGSGGGTLNALQYLEDSIGRHKLLASRVAIIHSGGDSRRAPLHSVCGKAWASINAVLPNGDVEVGDAKSVLATPIALLMQELCLFCRRASDSIVVIASNDVLLDIVKVTLFGCWCWCCT